MSAPPADEMSSAHQASNRNLVLKGDRSNDRAATEEQEGTRRGATWPSREREAQTVGQKDPCRAHHRADQQTRSRRYAARGRSQSCEAPTPKTPRDSKNTRIHLA